MNNLKPWYTLNVDVKNAIKDGFDFKKFFNESKFKGTSYGIWFIDSHELTNLFSESWLDYMKQIDLAPGSCMLFYRAPHFVYPKVHVDLSIKTSKPIVYGLNWVLDPDDDSEMIWYPNTNIEPETKLTPADNLYNAWPSESFADQEYVSKRIGNNLTLVNPGIPHNIIVREKERWAISLRFPANKNNNAITDWASAVEYFKPFIKE